MLLAVLRSMRFRITEGARQWVKSEMSSTGLRRPREARDRTPPARPRPWGCTRSVDGAFFVLRPGLAPVLRSVHQRQWGCGRRRRACGEQHNGRRPEEGAHGNTHCATNVPGHDITWRIGIAVGLARRTIVVLDNHGASASPERAGGFSRTILSPALHAKVRWNSERFDRGPFTRGIFLVSEGSVSSELLVTRCSTFSHFV